jgi:deazaflavin-dependent oxidoreductase (nitroreductase family)
VAGSLKHRLLDPVQRRVFNPPVKALLGLGVAPSGYALLETKGRRTGKIRRTPVGNGLAPDRDVFWIVAEHGRHAGYVRNIEANPRVRVKIAGRWHDGTATILPDDDPHERQRLIGQRVNATAVRAFGSDLLTVRIDLD